MHTNTPKNTPKCLSTHPLLYKDRALYFTQKLVANNGLGMAGGVLEGYDQAGGGFINRRYGGGLVVFSEARDRVRDSLFVFQGVSSAFSYWICSAVHL